jgi:peptide/nickel transport system substrate-binding protein
MKTILSSRRDRYLAMLCIFLVVVPLIAGVVGCGVEEEGEQEIKTWLDLDNIRNNLGGTYVLLNNLDDHTLGHGELASKTANGGKGWQPIGTLAKPFTGTFDGGGNTISDLFIYRPDEDEVGLFGRVQEPGLIENLGLVSVNVTGKKSVGALVGYSWKGTLDSDTRPAYGSKTYSRGSVTGEEDVGGLVGENYGGMVNQCESTADVLICKVPDQQRSRAGGLVGLNSGQVLYCAYNGAAKGDLEVGGLVGMNENIPTQVGVVQGCTSAYCVNGSSEVGGWAGRNLGIIRLCQSRCVTNWTSNVTCLIALNEGARGNADSPDTALPGWYVAGGVGYNGPNATVEECSADGAVEGLRYVGMLAGWNEGNVTGCNSSGDVTGNSDTGRLVGYNKGTVSNSESTSCVTGTSDCGPLVGTNVGEIIPGISIPLKNPGNFVQMTIGDVDSLDPAWAYDTASSEQVQYIYETLLFYKGTSTGEFDPVLATQWNASPDGKTIRFKIRTGVKFQNGDMLTPEDVEYSFERAMVQDRGGGPIWMLYTPLLGLGGSRDGEGNIQVTFNEIDKAVEVDGDWVQFNLVAPYPTSTFYQILCGPWASIVDKKWCIAQGDWDGTEATWKKYNNPAPETSKLHAKANGTGPWKLEVWDPGIQIKLVRNDNYWRTPASFERVITQIVEEWTTRKAALLAGDADFVYVPRMYIHELDDVAGLNRYQELPDLTFDAFFFNYSIASSSAYIGSGKLDGNGIPTDFFSDIDVRKGFSYAFDWDTYIAQAMQGEAEQRGSPIIKGLPYYNPNAAMYHKDLAKAVEHLKAAWGGQVWDKGFKLTLIYDTGNLVRKTACEILAENLAKINLKFQVKIQEMAWPTMLDAIVTKNMPMFQIGWLADYPDPDNFATPFMASWGSYAAFQSYSNPEVDALITEGATSIDPARRQQIYYKLQDIYYNDAPGISLVQPLGRRFFTKYIHGFYFNPMFAGQAGPLYHMSKSSS